MIRINCFFQANEGQYDAALQAALALTAASQKQEGCVSYDVFESGTRSDVFMFCETWTNAAALEAHAASEEFNTYVAQLKELGLLKIESSISNPSLRLFHLLIYILASCATTSRRSASRAMLFL